jgi:hypothetical protein
MTEAEHAYKPLPHIASTSLPVAVARYLDGTDLLEKTQALRGMCEVRLRARRLAHSSPEVPLAFFEAEVEAVRNHVAPYAAVTHGNTFALHEPQAVLPRWKRQIAALREAS